MRCGTTLKLPEAGYKGIHNFRERGKSWGKFLPMSKGTFYIPKMKQIGNIRIHVHYIFKQMLTVASANLRVFAIFSCR